MEGSRQSGPSGDKRSLSYRNVPEGVAALMRHRRRDTDLGQIAHAAFRGSTHAGFRQRDLRMIGEMEGEDRLRSTIQVGAAGVHPVEASSAGEVADHCAPVIRPEKPLPGRFAMRQPFSLAGGAISRSGRIDRGAADRRERRRRR